ncbi:MAG: TonB-dependent receptor [Arenicella sp.]|nr:TonB-dependent receptor [Arenicella sp.]
MKFAIGSKPKLSSLAIGVGLAMTAATPALAKQQLEEIIVTAQYRAQSIQDVPISITAIGSEELEAANIFDAGSLAVNVPGLSYGEFAPGQALISLRGVNSADDGAGLDNSVALFLDGVYIGRGAGINFDLFDLERIEVLKGPQGTLFGRNAIGGAISVVTEKPSQEFSGKAAVTVGNEGILRYQGLVSGGITDKLSGKLVVNHREHDGFVRNVLLGLDLQDEDQSTVRGQLLWEGENSEWLLSADHFEDERADAGRVPIAGPFFENGVAPSVGLTGPLQNTSPVEGFSDRETGGISLQGDIDFGSGKITTITAIRSVETDWELPSIGAPIGADLAAGVFGIDVIDDIEEEIDTFSQEFRWTSQSDSSFNYVVGAFFLIEDTDRREQFRLDRNTQATGQSVVGNEYTRTENETTSYALYGQGTWDINPKTTLSFGGRYSRDDRDYRASAINCDGSDEAIVAAGFADNSNCVFGGNRVQGSLNIINEVFIREADVDFDDFSPMASLQYRPNENTMYFGTVSTGYKSGGFAGSQGVASAATNVVNPEQVTNFELGFKGDFLDNTLRFNATAFVSDYEDLQVVRFGPVPNSDFGSFQTTNIGSADLSGVELDFIWYASDRIKFSGNYAYLDTEANDLVLQGANGSSDFSGLALRQAPEHSYSFTANYNLPTAHGEYDFRLQYSHVDEQHFDFPTITETIADEVDLLDLRINWVSSDEKYQLTLWGQNVTDEEYITHAFRIGPGSIGVYGAPATFGVTGTVNF